MKLPVEVHVFDFKNVEVVSNSFFEVFLKFKKNLLAKNIQVVSLNFKPHILEVLKKEGQDKALGATQGLDALSSAPPKEAELDTRNWLIKYLVAASRSAMNTMFNTTVAADENYRESVKNFRLDQFDRIAFVEANSGKAKGKFYLCFDNKTLEALTRITIKNPNILLDEELTSSTATELLNLIYNGAKSKINDERGYDLPNTIPTLIAPTEAQKLRLEDLKNVFVIPFATPVGTYYLEIDFRS